MAFTIQPRNIIINPTPTFFGTYDTAVPFASLNMRAVFNGRTYIPVQVGAVGNWSVTISDRLTTDGVYTLAISGTGVSGSITTEYAGPLYDGDVPGFSVPDNTAELATVSSSVNTTQSEFMGMTATTSSSCDLMGTVQGLASELTRTVRDAAGNAIGVIKESTATITSSIRGALSDAFGESGGFLNTLKGYASTAAAWVGDVKNSITSTVGDAVNWAKGKIQAGQAQIAEWMSGGEENEGRIFSLIKSTRALITSTKNTVQGFINTVQTKLGGLMTGVKNAAASLMGFMSDVRGQVTAMMGIVATAVTGIAQASCGAIASVLAGTPSDAFANITNGATDAATKAFGAAKGIFDSGADNMAEVNSKIVDSTGIGDVFTGIKDKTKALSGSIADRKNSFGSTTETGSASLYASLAARPVIA